jgi:hypothetical protein
MNRIGRRTIMCMLPIVASVNINRRHRSGMAPQSKIRV